MATKKRARGTGHVRARRLKNGQVVYQAGYPAAPRTRADGSTLNREHLRTFTREGDAHAWLNTMDRDKRHDELVDPSKRDKPFKEVVEAWKRTRWPRLQPASRARYEEVLRRWLMPEFGNVRLGAIDRERVAMYVAWLTHDAHRYGRDGKPTQQPLSPGSVRKIYTCLSSVMSQAVKLGMVRTNPCQSVDLPAVTHTEMLFLSSAELRALAAAVDEPYVRAADWYQRRGITYHPHFGLMVELAGVTGLRAGELVALRRGDYDPLRGELHVRRALKDIKTETFGPPKNGKVRTVPVISALRDRMSDHVAQLSPGGNGPESLLFPGVTGGLLRHGLFVRRTFRPAVRASLPAAKHGLRFHDLRHTAASLLIQADAHPKAIQTWLGHGSVAVTMDRYGHLLEGLGSLGDRLGAMYGADEPESGTVVEQCQGLGK